MKKRQFVSILLAMTLSFSMVAAPAGMASVVAAEVDGATADEGFGTGAEADSGDDAVIAEASEELFEELGDTDESFEEDVPEEIQNEIDSEQELEESADDDLIDVSDTQDATEETAGDDFGENLDEDAEAGEAEAGEVEAGKAEAEEAASGSDAVNAEADADVVEEVIVEEVAKAAQEGDTGDVVASGTCGTNVTWTLTGTGNNLTLTISGSGGMEGYSEQDRPQWESYRGKIVNVVIEDGVTSIGHWAFYRHTALKNVTISDSVTSIEASAFYKCSISSIVIPNSVKNIWGSAFAKTNLTEIELPEGVQKIDGSVFEECTKLKRAVIPGSVTYLGGGIFKGCSNLEEIILSNGIKNIPDNFAESCGSLQNVVIPNSVSRIGGFAFYGCSCLAGITIPDSVTTIGSHAFSYCYGLTEIVLPEGINEIESYAFSVCENLESVQLPDSLWSIEESAFGSCPNLLSITIPRSVISIEPGAFDWNTQLIVAKDSYAEEYAIENEYDFFVVDSENPNDPITVYLTGTCGNNVTWLLEGTEPNITLTISGSGAIENYNELDRPLWEHYRGKITNVVIEEGVTSIGSYAFYKHVALNNITISDSVTSIGTSAFYKCPMTSIEIPDSVISIGESVFHGCKLTAIELPGSVRSIGYRAFEGCTKLQSAAILGSVTYLGEETFKECGSLEEISLSEGITIIPDGFAQNCWSLRSIVIPSSVTRIGEFAFSTCIGLTDITIPSTVKTIGRHAFEYCSGLTELIIPEGINTIDSYAFLSCTNLENVQLPEGLASIGQGAFDGCPKLTSIHIPGSVLSIEEGAFCSDTQLIVERGSYAEEYAEVNGYDYIVICVTHVWNEEYTVDVEPTYTEDGVESIHCAYCDAIKEGSQRAIPKLGKPISSLIISGVENKTYEGQEVTLDLVVIDDETVLEQGFDYEVEYENNSYVGKATVTVKGIGNYSGEVSRQFLILPGAPAKVTCKNLADGIKISWEKVEGATSYYVYRDDKLLFRESRLERLDREVKYECGKKYTYRVIATTKDVGNSTRSRTCKMFRLMPVKITKLSNPSAGKLKVEYEKSPGCYGYVVRYGLKSDMSDASVVSVKGENTLSRVFNGAKKGKTYYVQVRTYMLEFGLRYYSGYCTTQKITIKK